MTIAETYRTVRAVLRSLNIYYRGSEQRRALDRHYGQFVGHGDLVFDIGAHVGDRVGAFLRLGARVVAVEPQPAMVATLRLLYGRRPQVAIEAVAVGRRSGAVEFSINMDNPTVSTASKAFVAAAAGAPGWEGQVWTKAITVPLTTLDALIARHGMPSFIKIDIEGFEAEALAGLSQPVAALSFEFTTIQRDVALACIARCGALGFRHYQAALGESQMFVFDCWQGASEIACWLANLPTEANSGDIYAIVN
jgi:FkbM family methyltransferase